MKKILPLGNALLQCYPNYVGILSITDAYTKDYIPWIYDRFVQLVVPAEYESGLRVDYAVPNIVKDFPWLDSGRIERDVIFEKWGSMVEFIKERISAGWYVHALFDVSKITAYGDSGLMIHDPFIYGYDDLEKNMYFMDNYQYGKSAQGLACYADINASSISIMENYDSIDWLGGIIYFRPKKIFDFGNGRFADSYKYKFDLPLYTLLLSDYLEERDSCKRWGNPSVLSDENVAKNFWGIGIYKHFIDYVKMIKKKEYHVDLRASYVLREHKMLMKKTIRYLRKIEGLEINKCVDAKMDACIQLSTVTNNLFMKYICRNDNHILDKIMDYYKQLYEIDYLLVRELYDCLTACI